MLQTIQKGLKICKLVRDDFLCDEFSIGRTALYENFKKYCGESIAKYIRRRRIEEAAKYIRETNAKVKETAEYMGFLDYNYFSKIFKAIMGVSPLEYKKSMPHTPPPL